jgi:hypothetical protein
MPSSGMLRRVALVRTDVSEESIAYINRVTRIDKLGAALALPSKRNTLFTRATWRNFPDDAIVHLSVNISFKFKVIMLAMGAQTQSKTLPFILHTFLHFLS